jgi:uncharacterized membrane protein
MNLKRVIRHLLMTRWRVNLAFPARTLSGIENAIAQSHTAHLGQVRFAVEGALHSASLFKGESARTRAIEVFSELRVWDTEYNNGVLIYLLLADRDVEIVADRGVHGKVTADDWESICRHMEADFRLSRYESGVVKGIRDVTELLKKHFPVTGSKPDELSSTPVVL